MTKQEAFQAMLDGNKITHYYFSSDEYLYIQDVSFIKSKT